MLTAASEIGYLQSCVFLGGKGGAGKIPLPDHGAHQ